MHEGIASERPNCERNEQLLKEVVVLCACDVLDRKNSQQAANTYNKYGHRAVQYGVPHRHCTRCPILHLMVVIVLFALICFKGCLRSLVSRVRALCGFLAREAHTEKKKQTRELLGNYYILFTLHPLPSSVFPLTVYMHFFRILIFQFLALTHHIYLFHRCEVAEQ